MSTNENTVYVFVKGNKGKCAYEITDTTGAKIWKDKFEGLENDKKEPLYQSHSDWIASIKSLEYICENRGNHRIPKEPMIFIFTTYENIYHIANNIKKPNAESSKKYLNIINKLKAKLIRKSHIGSDDNLKFHYLPDGFKNKMDEVDELLGNIKNKKSNRP